MFDFLACASCMAIPAVGGLVVWALLELWNRGYFKRYRYDFDSFGKCQKCGYAMGTLKICPECGTDSTKNDRARRRHSSTPR